MLSSGSKICEGSIPSAVVVRRLRDVRGVGRTSAVVFRLVDRLGLRFGAGVKSSSLSSAAGFCVALTVSSSDSSSTMTLRRAAARRDGL